MTNTLKKPIGTGRIWVGTSQEALWGVLSVENATERAGYRVTGQGAMPPKKDIFRHDINYSAINIFIFSYTNMIN